MSAADERLAGLLNRWSASVDLHVRYLALDDAAYARVQDWPKHQRPNRWVLELARARLVELQRLADERRSHGDTGFAEALELMAFLTSLLGSEHVERFIPLPAEGKARPTAATAPSSPRSDPRQAAAPAPAPEPKSVAPSPPAPEPRPVAALPPQPEPAARRTPAPPSASASSPPPERAERATASRAGAAKSRSGEARSSGARNPPRGTAQSRPARRTEAPAPERTPERKPSAPAPAKATPGGHDAATMTVIADAVRLLNWGRHWPQLASLIARLADRPAEPEVWTILRAHRAEIEALAKPPPE